MFKTDNNVLSEKSRKSIRQISFVRQMCEADSNAMLDKSNFEEVLNKVYTQLTNGLANY